jgi:hypothetical protein
MVFLIDSPAFYFTRVNAEWLSPFAHARGRRASCRSGKSDTILRILTTAVANPAVVR